MVEVDIYQHDDQPKASRTSPDSSAINDLAVGCCTENEAFQLGKTWKLVCFAQIFT